MSCWYNILLPFPYLSVSLQSPSSLTLHLQRCCLFETTCVDGRINRLLLLNSIKRLAVACKQTVWVMVPPSPINRNMLSTHGSLLQKH
mmetsp:Transcript_14201/g.30497  ORF Transcript_14201/g.30497 Transcript_14201/m.30497 type:complete len:88 (-) Transcript_14201:1200-1463(-)